MGDARLGPIKWTWNKRLDNPGVEKEGVRLFILTARIDRTIRI